jgi:transposase
MGTERKKSEAPGTERGRSPSGVPGARAERGRWTSRAKMETVLRILRGEDLDALSRELGVSSGRLAQWRDDFLAGGQANLKSRQPDVRDEENRRLKRKVGELTMDAELFEEKIARLESGLGPPPRGPRR